MARDAGEIVTKRIYDPPSEDDGLRVLVDRLWPRGISKDKAGLAAWMREIAPSDALRKKFHGHPEKWQEFVAAYAAELEHRGELVRELRAMAKRGRVTLLFAAKDEARNNAVALKTLLEKGRP